MSGVHIRHWTRYPALLDIAIARKSSAPSAGGLPVSENRDDRAGRDDRSSRPPAPAGTVRRPAARAVPPRAARRPLAVPVGPALAGQPSTGSGRPSSSGRPAAPAATGRSRRGGSGAGGARRISEARPAQHAAALPGRLATPAVTVARAGSSRRCPRTSPAAELERSVRAELSSLAKLNAETVARHLVMAGRLLDEDPEARVRARRLRPRARRPGRGRPRGGRRWRRTAPAGTPRRSPSCAPRGGSVATRACCR